MPILMLLTVLTALVLAPLLASKVMGLRGGLGKSALIAFISLGGMQIVGMLAQHLGPLGNVLGLMGGIAVWYQVVRIVHGTKTAETIVFIFWHLFFQLLMVSLLSLIFEPSLAWVWGL